VITTACHFPELAAAEGAIVVTPDADDITRGLLNLLERSPRERLRLGQNGRRLVEQHYTWDQQAQRLASVYHWLIAGGHPPAAVIM
jgi:glycosyltransferase involved in cell wall biosynthesis